MEKSSLLVVILIVAVLGDICIQLIKNRKLKKQLAIYKEDKDSLLLSIVNHDVEKLSLENRIRELEHQLTTANK